jgi:hypothetical protein
VQQRVAEGRRAAHLGLGHEDLLALVAEVSRRAARLWRKGVEVDVDGHEALAVDGGHAAAVKMRREEAADAVPREPEAWVEVVWRPARAVLVRDDQVVVERQDARPEQLGERVVVKRHARRLECVPGTGPNSVCGRRMAAHSSGVRSASMLSTNDSDSGATCPPPLGVG